MHDHSRRLALSRANVVDASASNRMAVPATSLYLLGVVSLGRTDDGWSTALEAALTASRRVDLQRGTNAAYVAGCVAANAAVIKGSGWRSSAVHSRHLS
jgi:hypothetical protein